MSYSLRPLAAKDEVDSDLSSLVGRIIQERGHFKDVTEESLQEEIGKEQKPDEGDDELEDDSSKPQTLEGRRAELGAARFELVTELGRAQNDIGMALDFVSFLLSKDRVDKANVSMSPFLKDLLKDNMGSLAFDSFEPNPPSEAKKQAESDIAMGWNLQRLGASADSLLSSAVKLESEMKKEAQYWDDVLSISEKGWSLCRLSGGSTIGVRYGFTEAAPQFNAQGLAALRPTEAGNVRLDQGLRRIPRTVRVQVKEGSRTISKSQVRACESEQAPIETMIRQARDSLFEEELYHELNREANDSLSLGITVEDGAITAPLGTIENKARKGMKRTQRHVVIELVSRSNNMLDSVDPDTTADTIAVSLRILMAHLYRQRFKRRTRPPLPLSKDKTSSHTPQLLRPILNHALHHAAVSAIDTFMKPIASTLKSAGISESFLATQAGPSSLSLRELIASKKGSSNEVERFVDMMRDTLSSTISLTVNEQKIAVTIRTHLAPPYYGTQYSVMKSSASGLGGIANANYDDLDHTQEYVDALIRESIAAESLARLPGWQLEQDSATLSKASAHDVKRRKTSVHIAVANGILALMGDNSENASEPKVWGVWDGTGKTANEKDWNQVLEEATKVI